MSNQTEYYSMILNNFRIVDLKELLKVYGGHQFSDRAVLICRAIEILRTKQSPQFINSYLSTIHKIFCAMPNYDAVMKLIQASQRQKPMKATGNIRIPATRQIRNRPPPPPNPEQTMSRINRAESRSNVGANTIQGSSNNNNNIQNSSGNYQVAGPSTVASQLRLSQPMNLHINQPSTAVNPNLPAGINNLIPTSETLRRLEFKKLTFYDVLNEIVMPTALYATNKTAVRTSRTFILNLSAKQANIVSLNHNLSDSKNDYPYQYQIRICQVKSDHTEVTDYLPRGIKILVNDNFNQLPPEVRSKNAKSKREYLRISKPIDITNNIKLSPFITNNITISWYTDTNYYAIGIYIVRLLTVDNLIQRLKQKASRSSEETIKYITEKLADNDPDFATTYYLFSLVCPLSKIRMKIPAKSIHCEHLQCFDAYTFILMNEKNPTWKCPTCNKPCFYEDIQIQNYFLEVVTSPSLEHCTTIIQILADGTWKVYDENKDNNNATTSGNTVEILESDDEESDRMQGVIDLTLIDD